MAKQSDEDINLNFLKTIDNKIENVLLNGGQSALYEFIDGKWIRKHIEGTLFVVKRSQDPLCKIIIPNKLASLEDDVFQEIVTENFEVSLEAPYALCKNADNVINCFWFYKKENCELFEKTIRNCILKIREEKEKKVLNAGFGKMNLNSVPSKPDAVQMLCVEDIENGILNGVSTKKQQTPNVTKSSQAKLENTQKALFETMFSQARRSVNFRDLINQKPSSENNANAQQATTKNVSGDDTSPTPNVTSSFVNKSPSSNQTPKISVEELKQTLIHLLQNDADFLFKVYETYKDRVTENNQ